MILQMADMMPALYPALHTTTYTYSANVERFNVNMLDGCKRRFSKRVFNLSIWNVHHLYRVDG